MSQPVPRPIFHVEMPTSDQTASSEFYEQLFGWDCYDRTSPIAAFQTGSISGGFPKVGEGLVPLTEHFRPGEVVLYVMSDDIEADLARAETLGGDVLLPRIPLGNSRAVGLFRDPGGVAIVLAELG